MNTEYSFETGVFSGNYDILKNDRRVGFIKSSLFSRKATAEIDGKQYEFRDNRWFKPKTAEIFDASGNVIGKIKYDYDVDDDQICCIIKINDETSYCVQKSFSKDWKVHNSSGLNILYSPLSYFSTRGKIVTNKENGVKLLSGLYVMNSFAKWAYAMLAGGVALVIVIAAVSTFTNISISDILRWIF